MLHVQNIYNYIYTQLNTLKCLEEVDETFKEAVLDLMTQCGCDVELKVSKYCGMFRTREPIRQLT